MLLQLVLVSLALLPSCSEKKEASPLAPPTYETLHTQNTHGAFFQLRHQNKFYIACSIHQGAAANGTQLFRPHTPLPTLLTERIHIQKDLHLWKYDPQTLSEKDALLYLPEIKLLKGDRIFILNKGQKIPATITSLPKNQQFRFSYKSDRPFAAGGMSGSPIFLPRSGSVIGVLQTANDKRAATRGGFEQITLP